VCGRCDDGCYYVQLEVGGLSGGSVAYVQPGDGCLVELRGLLFFASYSPRQSVRIVLRWVEVIVTVGFDWCKVIQTECFVRCVPHLPPHGTQVQLKNLP
jgi:hypothetical protein